MTLVIALACKDGVVMASDGQVTIGSSGGPVKLETVKINSLGPTTLWGASTGDLGFVQTIGDRLASLPGELRQSNLDALAPTIIQLIQQARQEALTRYRSLYGPDRYREQGFADISWANVIFASFSSGGPKILQVYADCHYVWLQEFGYAAIGSGDVFAYTLLKNHQVRGLPVAAGKLLAFHVINEAIEVGAFGLGEPIDLWTITHEERDRQRVYVSRQVQEAEMRLLGELRARWMEQERQLFAEIVDAVKG